MANGVKRVQFEFSQDTIDDIDSLKISTESSSRNETVRKALNSLKILSGMVKDGYELEFVKGKDRQRVIIL